MLQLYPENALERGIDTFLADYAVPKRLQHSMINLPGMIIAMCHHQDILPRLHGLYPCIMKAVMLGKRPQFHSIRDNDTLPAKLPAQQIRHNHS